MMIRLKFDSNCANQRTGFTVVELISVIGVVMILIALALPAVQSIREATRRAVCGNRLRQIGIALHNHHDRARHFPTVPDPSGRVFHWAFSILPELEQNAMQNAIRQELRIGVHWASLTQGRTSLETMMCASNPYSGMVFRHRISGRLFAQSNYIGISGVKFDEGMFPNKLDFERAGALREGIRSRDIRDGLSNTLAMGERLVKPNNPVVGAWLASQEYGHDRMGIAVGSNLYPRHVEGDCDGVRFGPGEYENPCSQFHHWSLHPGGSHFLLADGAMRFIDYSVDEALIEAMSTIRGGEQYALGD